MPPLGTVRSMKPDFPLDRRRLLQAAAALGAAASAGWTRAAAPATDLSGVTLRVGTYKGLWRPLLTASGQANTPYKIDWRELNNGVLHIEAINGDALDLGSGSEIPPVFAARQKSSVRLVAVTHEDLNNQATLARKDAPIRTIADFKGKRVGYVRATTSHYYLARGDLDAWAIYGYNGQLARIQYGARVIKTGVGYLSGNFPIYANPRALDDAPRRAALADLLQRLQRAFAWSNGNFLTYARAQSAETRVPVGDIVELFNGRSSDYSLGPVSDAVVRSHQDVADTFLKIGVLDGPADVRPLWDRSFESVLRLPVA